jgi:hypothetical protein
MCHSVGGLCSIEPKREERDGNISTWTMNKVNLTNLDEILLCPWGINSRPGRRSSCPAQEIGGLTTGKIRNAHMLRPERNEVSHRRAVIPLHIRAEELTA